MGIVDITGPIQNGMWSYGNPFPDFKLTKLPKIEWLKEDVYCEIFEGMNSQTGTYIETPAHFFGNDKGYLMNDVPLEKLVDIDCVILNLNKSFSKKKRIAITVEDLKDGFSDYDIRAGDAIIVGTGWGRHWMNDFYMSASPFFTYDAMMWLIDKTPYLLGSDFPRWDNLEHREGFFPMFYKRDILMLAPCINIEKITSKRVKLTVAPINIIGSSCVPCRAFITIPK